MIMDAAYRLDLLPISDWYKNKYTALAAMRKCTQFSAKFYAIVYPFFLYFIFWLLFSHITSPKRTITKLNRMLSSPGVPLSRQTTTEQIRLVIADDHPLAREGLLSMLSTYEEVCVVGEASNGKQLTELVKTQKPDVVLTDLKMPHMDGIQAIREIKGSNETTRCLLVSQYGNDSIIVEAFQAGAMGYLVKTASKEEIFEAVSCVYGFGYYYSQIISLKLRRIISGQGPLSFMPGVLSLTKRDRDIIYLLCEGKSNREIGEILCISHRTVEGIKSKIMEKTGTDSTAGIIIYAIQNGLYRTFD